MHASVCRSSSTSLLSSFDDFLLSFSSSLLQHAPTYTHTYSCIYFCVYMRILLHWLVYVPSIQTASESPSLSLSLSFRLHAHGCGGNFLLVTACLLCFLACTLQRKKADEERFLAENEALKVPFFVLFFCPSCVSSPSSVQSGQPLIQPSRVPPCMYAQVSLYIQTHSRVFLCLFFVLLFLSLPF